MARDPNPVTAGLYVPEVNDLIDAHGCETRLTLRDHVLELVLLPLLIACVAGCGVLSYANGLGGSRRPMLVTVGLNLFIAPFRLRCDRPPTRRASSRPGTSSGRLTGSAAPRVRTSTLHRRSGSTQSHTPVALPSRVAPNMVLTDWSHYRGACLPHGGWLRHDPATAEEAGPWLEVSLRW